MQPTKLIIHIKNHARKTPLSTIVRPMLVVSDIRHRHNMSKRNGMMKNFKHRFFKFSKVIKMKIILKSIMVNMIPLSSQPKLIKSRV